MCKKNYYFKLKDKNTDKVVIDGDCCPTFVNNKEDYKGDMDKTLVIKIKYGDVVRINKEHVTMDMIIALTDKFNLEFHQITKDTFDIKFKNKEMLVCNSKQLLERI